MADSKKHQADLLSLQEAADPLDVHYILADPIRGRGFSVGDLERPPHASPRSSRTKHRRSPCASPSPSPQAIYSDTAPAPSPGSTPCTRARELGVMTRAIVWFRRDLSVDDNLAWATATREHTEVLPVYVFDRRLLDRAGPHRRRQLIASVAALADELRTLGGLLTVATGDPIESVTRLAHEHRVDTVMWNNRAYETGASARRHRAPPPLALGHLGRAVMEHTHSSAGHCPHHSRRRSPRLQPVLRTLVVRIAARAVAHRARAHPCDQGRLAPIDRWHRTPSRPGAKPRATGSPRSSNGSTPTTPNAISPGRDATSHLSADLRFGTISPRQVVRAAAGTTPGRRGVRPPTRMAGLVRPPLRRTP